MLREHRLRGRNRRLRGEAETTIYRLLEVRALRHTARQSSSDLCSPDTENLEVHSHRTPKGPKTRSSDQKALSLSSRSCSIRTVPGARAPGTNVGWDMICEWLNRYVKRDLPKFSTEGLDKYLSRSNLFGVVSRGV